MEALPLAKFNNVAITGRGLVCSLGLDVMDACAAAHAGLVRAAPLDYLVFNESDLEDEPVAGHSVPVITSGFSGIGRMYQMGKVALSNMLKTDKVASVEDTAICLLANSGYYKKIYLERQSAQLSDELKTSESLEYENALAKHRLQVKNELLPSILSAANLLIPSEHQYLRFGGTAQFVKIIHEAGQLIESGRYKHIIVGGIDSFVEPSQLELLHELGILKTPGDPVGFMPGEAAGFIRLSHRSTVRSEQVLARLSSASSIEKDAPMFGGVPATGKAMADVVASVVAGSQTNLAYCINVNGTTYRAADFGIAQVRLKSNPGIDNMNIKMPVASFGEIGVASGPAAVCYALHGITRNPRRNSEMANGAVIGLYSDDGERGAFRIGRS